MLWLNLHDFAFNYPAADPGTTYWNAWWFDQAVRKFQNPYWCPILFHPFGAPLYMTTFELVDIVFTAPIRWLFGTVVSIKAELYLHTLWTSVAVHALMRRLGLRRAAAVVCAVAWAHCSYRYINVKAVSLLSTGHPVFVLWALAGAVKKPGSVRDGVFMGLGAILCAFSMLYYLLFLTALVPAAAASAALCGRWRPGKAWWLGFARSCGIAILVAIIPVGFLYVGTRQSASHLGMVAEYADNTKIRGAAELVQFALPVKVREIVTGNPVPELPYTLLAMPGRSFSYALPATILAGAVAGLLLRRRRPDAFPRFDPRLRAAILGIVVASLVLGLGPVVKVWTHVDPADVVDWDKPVPPDWQGISFPSPFAFVGHLPLWGHVRAAGRLGIFYQLGLLALAAPAFAAAVLALRDVASRRNALLARCVPVAAILAVYAEDFRGLYVTEPAPVSAVFYELRDRPGDGAVHEFPDIGYFMHGMMMFHQTVHGKPLMGGYLARDPADYEYWLREQPWSRHCREYMFSGKPHAMTEDERHLYLRSARESGLRYIVWHTGILPHPSIENLSRFMDGNRLGTPFASNDEDVLAWELADP